MDLLITSPDNKIKLIDSVYLKLWLNAKSAIMSLDP